MKNNSFFSILTCLFIMLLTACEKSEIQKGLPNDASSISSRTIKCDDCPANDCCCGMEVITGGISGANFSLCGTSSPDNTTTTCSGTINSCSFSGFILPFTLSSTQTGIFCMPPGSAFRVTSNTNLTVRISCHAGVFGAQSIDVPLTANTPVAIAVGSDCDVAACQ